MRGGGRVDEGREEVLCVPMIRSQPLVSLC